MVPAASAGPRCRAPRLAGADEAQVLARASWAVRRLLGQGPAAEIDPRGFPGRTGVTAAQDPDPEADRPVGVELDALGEVPRAHHDQLGAAHAMTRAVWPSGAATGSPPGTRCWNRWWPRRAAGQGGWPRSCRSRGATA